MILKYPAVYRSSPSERREKEGGVSGGEEFGNFECAKLFLPGLIGSRLVLHTSGIHAGKFSLWKEKNSEYGSEKLIDVTHKDAIWMSHGILQCKMDRALNELIHKRSRTLVQMHPVAHFVGESSIERAHLTLNGMPMC